MQNRTELNKVGSVRSEANQRLPKMASVGKNFSSRYKLAAFPNIVIFRFSKRCEGRLSEKINGNLIHVLFDENFSHQNF